MKKFTIKNIQVIPTGTEEKNSSKRVRKKNIKRIKILCVGHLSQRKGQIYLLKAFKNLLGEYPYIELLFVGEGEEKHVYENFVKKNKLSNSVHFLGRRQPNDMKKIYKESTIFCLASLSDPSPSVILEAMSYGMPIVASDTGSIKEMVENSGILVKPGDDEALRKALAKLIQNENLRNKMSKLAIKRIHDIYSWDCISKQWIVLYKSLLIK